MAGAALGLAALLASSAMAFSAVKYLGAGYLVYLGVRKLTSTALGESAEACAVPSERHHAIFAKGILVAVLNPKTALFFLAFLPQFVDPARGAPTAQVLMLGGMFVGLGTISDSAYALLAGTFGRWLWGHRRCVQGERYVTGTVYVGLGALAALSSGPGVRSVKP